MTADEPASITITVDGTLSGDCVDPVEACCTRAIAKEKPVQLFLRDVTTIDEGGRSLLRRLAAKGVDLTATGIYSSYVAQVSRLTGPPQKHPAR
ncbi:MAG: hypothetical protein LC130_24495 [Bryobacterales bacterium]|nr:hypothetical protein [Bryobacterales bacterium]